MRLERHLLQQVLHVFLLHKVLGSGGPVAQNADRSLAASAEKGSVLYQVSVMVVLRAVNILLNSILDELECPIVAELSSNKKQPFDLMVAVLLQMLEYVGEDRFLVERFG